MLIMSEARLIIIGAGKMGGFHGVAAKAIKRCELVGINSRSYSSAQKLAEKLQIEHFGNDLPKLVQETQANSCIIAVSHHVTADILDQCIDLGLHCLVEKPVGLDSERIQQLAQKAKTKDLKVMVAVNRRFYNTVQSALLHTNYYGGTGAINLVASDYPDLYRLNATLAPEVYDTWPIMNTIHAFDLLSLFGQGIQTVHIVVSNNHNGIDAGKNIQALMKGKNGSTINFSYAETSGTMQSWKLNISGSNYAINFGPLEKMQIDFALPGVQSILQTEHSEYKEGIYEQLAFFVDIVVNNLDVKFPACTLEEHANIVRIMQNIFKLNISKNHVEA